MEHFPKTNSVYELHEHPLIFSLRELLSFFKFEQRCHKLADCMAAGLGGEAFQSNYELSWFVDRAYYNGFMTVRGYLMPFRDDAVRLLRLFNGKIYQYNLRDMSALHETKNKRDRGEAQ